MRLIVNSIGDANCISVLNGSRAISRAASGSNTGLVIDFGKFNNQTNGQSAKTGISLFSYTHADCYGVFSAVKKKKYLNDGLRHFYYQKFLMANNSEKDRQKGFKHYKFSAGLHVQEDTWHRLMR